MRSKSIQLSKAKADKYFSEYIRKRDANDQGICQCCTCGKHLEWKKMDAGHFMSRRYNSTRYDEKNANAQCPYCNRFDQGRQHIHGEYINKKYGKGTTDQLHMKAIWISRRTQNDYEAIAELFKEKAKKLNKLQ